MERDTLSLIALGSVVFVTAMEPAIGLGPTVRHYGTSATYSCLQTAEAAAQPGDIISQSDTVFQACTLASGADAPITKDGTLTCDIPNTCTYEAGAGAHGGNITVSQGLLIIGGYQNASTAPNFTVTGIAISGAYSADYNGSDIWYATGNLTVNGAVLENAQMGILAPPLVYNNGSVIVKNSRITAIGTIDKTLAEHAIYCGNLKLCDVENSEIDDVWGGHYFKSRAYTTTLLNSVLDDTNGEGSQMINIPEMGIATISGDTVIKGANAQTGVIVGVGGDELQHPLTSISIINSKFINNYTLQPAILLDNNSNSPALWFAGNSITNNGQLDVTLHGPGQIGNNFENGTLIPRSLKPFGATGSALDHSADTGTDTLTMSAVGYFKGGSGPTNVTSNVGSYDWVDMGRGGGTIAAGPTSNLGFWFTSQFSSTTMEDTVSPYVLPVEIYSWGTNDTLVIGPQVSTTTAIESAEPGATLNLIDSSTRAKAPEAVGGTINITPGTSTIVPVVLPHVVDGGVVNVTGTVNAEIEYLEGGTANVNTGAVNFSMTGYGAMTNTTVNSPISLVTTDNPFMGNVDVLNQGSFTVSMNGGSVVSQGMTIAAGNSVADTAKYGNNTARHGAEPWRDTQNLNTGTFDVEIGQGVGSIIIAASSTAGVAGPVVIEVGPKDTGTVTVSGAPDNYQAGYDSIKLDGGVTVTGTALAGGALTVTFSNSAKAILPGTTSY